LQTPVEFVQVVFIPPVARFTLHIGQAGAMLLVLKYLLAGFQLFFTHGLSYLGDHSSATNKSKDWMRRSDLSYSLLGLWFPDLFYIRLEKFRVFILGNWHTRSGVRNYVNNGALLRVLVLFLRLLSFFPSVNLEFNKLCFFFFWIYFLAFNFFRHISYQLITLCQTVSSSF
jgi:hypothetical protein